MGWAFCSSSCACACYIFRRATRRLAGEIVEIHNRVIVRIIYGRLRDFLANRRIELGGAASGIAGNGGRLRVRQLLDIGRGIPGKAAAARAGGSGHQGNGQSQSGDQFGIFKHFTRPFEFQERRSDNHCALNRYLGRSENLKITKAWREKCEKRMDLL
jgi:hypothetical protein